MNKDIPINERRQILERIDDYKQLTNNFSTEKFVTLTFKKIPFREIHFNNLPAEELVHLFEFIIKTYNKQ